MCVLCLEEDGGEGGRGDQVRMCLVCTYLPFHEEIKRKALNVTFRSAKQK